MPSAPKTSLPFYAPSGSLYQWKGLEHVVTIDGINGLATGATPILTVPAGYSCVIRGAVVRLTGVTGAPTVGSAKIENTTDAVDLIAAAALTGLTTTSLAFALAPAGAYARVPAAKVISMNVTAAYTVASAVTLSVDLFCYLI